MLTRDTLVPITDVPNPVRVANPLVGHGADDLEEARAGLAVLSDTRAVADLLSHGELGSDTSLAPENSRFRHNMFAYGIAVAGDMLITSLLVAIVAHGVWKWPGFIVIVVAGLFLILDATFVLVRRYPLRLQLTV